MTILVIKHALPMLMLQRIPRSRNVNKQPRANINPPRINHIKPIIQPTMLKVRIHLEQKHPLPLHAPVLVVVRGHVVVGCQVVHARLRDLHVGVEVPRHDLLSPPPAEQGAVHEPCLDAEISKGGEVGLHEDLDGLVLLIFVEGVGYEPGIIMGSRTGIVKGDKVSKEGLTLQRVSTVYR